MTTWSQSSTPALAAADQRDAGVEEPDGLGPLAGGGDVVLRGPLADLPVAVHLVAEPPVPDPVGLVVPVGPPAVGPVGVAGAVAVLDPGQGLVQGARAHVQAEHRLHPGCRAQAMNSSVPKRLDSSLRQASSARRGRSSAARCRRSSGTRTRSSRLASARAAGPGRGPPPARPCGIPARPTGAIPRRTRRRRCSGRGAR